MFLFLLQDWYKATLSVRMSMSGTVTAKTPFILANILPWPISYAEVSTGYVFMANGFMPMMKWDGVSYSALTVGVTRPATALTLSSTGSGTITGTYTAYARWVDKDGNPSNLSPISNSITITDRLTIRYADVPLTTDPKVTRLQILRNTDGQATVYYVDVETTDLTGTEFTSTLTDTQLQAQEAVPLFDADRRSIANRFGIPPDHKPFLAQFLGRMFAYGDHEYSDGHVEVTYGSTTVTGVGTDWKTAMEGRILYVVGSPRSYSITTVNEAAQTLTLSEVYADETNVFGVYSIRSAPTERRLVYFSEAGSFDAWPASNALEVEENGDDGTGLIASDSFLFVIQKRHIYRLTYNNNPLTDGGLFQAAQRGCINNRCVVKVDSMLYLLDEQGVYKLASGGEPETASDAVQDLFWTASSDIGLRINWKSQRYFHASLSQAESTIRWFVALDGRMMPRHALALHYPSGAWTIEDYPCDVGASCLMRPTSTRAIPIVAGPSGRAFSLDGGVLDMVKPTGTTRGTLTGQSYLSAAVSSAKFQTAGLVGSPVSIVDGRGKGQQRRIVVRSATLLTIDRPWLIMPDATSILQIGGVHWSWLGVWSRWLDEDTQLVRRMVFVFEPSENPNLLSIRMYREHDNEPTPWGYSRESSDVDAVTVREDDTDLLVDLTNAKGFAQVRMDGRRERYLMNRDFFTLEFDGVSGESPIRLYGIIVEGSDDE